MATTDKCTVVAVFRSASEAQNAANELKNRGISAGNIHISSESSAAGSSGYAQTSGTQHEGGFTGWLKSLFGSEEHDDHARYQNAIAGGNVALLVDTDEQEADNVSDLLNRFSPVDVHTEDTGTTSGISTSNTENAGYPTPADTLSHRTGAGAAVAAATTGAAATLGGRSNTGTSPNAATRTAAAAERAGDAISVVQEDLKVGKRAVQRGGVRVYSRLVEQPVEESVRLREEHVRVDRQPVNRPVEASDLRTGGNQVIEVKEYAEEPVVAKEARVVEEVRVNKEVGERTETIRDTVRHTDVNVEPLTADATTSTAGSDVYGDEDFRSDFQRNYGASGGNYSDYAPAYRFGYDAGNDARWRGRDYSSVESDLRNEYASRYPNSTWDQVKNSVRYGWDKVTGKARSATTSNR